MLPVEVPAALLLLLLLEPANEDEHVAHSHALELVLAWLLLCAIVPLALLPVVGECRPGSSIVGCAQPASVPVPAAHVCNAVPRPRLGTVKGGALQKESRSD